MRATERYVRTNESLSFNNFPKNKLFQEFYTLYKESVKLLDNIKYGPRNIRVQKILDKLNMTKSLGLLVVKYDYFIEGFLKLDIQAHSDSINSIIVLPATGEIVTGGSVKDPIIKIWNVGSLVKSLYGNILSVDNMTAMSLEDGDRIITVSNLRDLKLWDPISTLNILTLAGHSEKIKKIKISSDNKIISLSADSIRIWNPYSGECETIIRNNPLSQINDFDILPNGKLVSVSQNRTITIWNKSISEDLIILNFIPFSIATIDNDHIAIGSLGGGHFYIWNIQTKEYDYYNEANLYIDQILPFSNGNLLTTEKFSIQIRDSRSNKILSTFFGGWNSTRNNFLVLPNNNVIIGFENGDLKIWNPEENRIEKVIKSTDGITYIQISKNLEIIVGTKSGILQIWE